MLHVSPVCVVRVAACCAVMSFVSIRPTLAMQDSTTQTGPNVPRVARDLVAHVIAFHSGAEEDGAGVFVGEDSVNVYFFTAAHVVEGADSIHLEFASARGQWLAATVDSMSMSSDVDLAVIHIEKRATHDIGLRLATNRLGKSADVHDGDEVIPVGCPTGECWQAPVPPDRVLASNGLEISFQSFFVDRGSSGGAIFNRWWEVVGMVFNDAPPRAVALPVDYIVMQVDRWGIPVSLSRPSIPRGGYKTSIGVTLLMSASNESIVRPDGLTPIAIPSRSPGGRITFSRKFQPVLSWHVGAMQLRPKNLTITGGTVGMGLDLQWGRLKIRPFGELGVARMESRVDAGGYLLDVDPVYKPVWERSEKDGTGIGGGATLEFTVLPNVIVEFLGATWEFSVPDNGQNSPALPRVFFGGGLRLGL